MLYFGAKNIVLRLVLASFAFFIFSCSNTGDGKHNNIAKDSTPPKPVAANIANISVKDTLIVSATSAVFYYPDSAQIERRKKEIGEDTFYIGADDYAFYLDQCYNYFKGVELKTTEAKEVKYIKFVKADNTSTWVKLDTLPDLWGVFLFKPQKEPRLADMIAIEDDYKDYYK